MNRPALAFGVLMPYIRSEEELNVAVEAWIRSHFLHKRVERYFSFSFFRAILEADEMVCRIFKMSSTPLSLQPASENKLSVNLSIPHSCKCVYNALILMSGAYHTEDSY